MWSTASSETALFCTDFHCRIPPPNQLSRCRNPEWWVGQKNRYFWRKSYGRRDWKRRRKRRERKKRRTCSLRRRRNWKRRRIWSLRRRNGKRRRIWSLRRSRKKTGRCSESLPLSSRHYFCSKHDTSRQRSHAAQAGYPASRMRCRDRAD